MKIISLKRSLLAGLLIQMISTFSLGNGWSSNGGDMTRELDNIWNLGQDPVKYCVVSSADYPLSHNDLRQMVENSLGAWTQFFARYGLQAAKFGASQSGNRMPKFPDRKARGISLDFIELDSCPPESVDSVVRFVFGKIIGPIQNYLYSSKESSLGVAIRKAYDHNHYRNGGYVFVANFTNDRKKIKHMLLHEMGHMFGMPHDSVFVMYEEVAHLLTDNQFQADHLWGHIENDFWPYRLKSGESVNLSSESSRKILKKTNQSSPGVCQNQSMQTNRKIPPKLRQRLGLPANGCHKLVLTLGEKHPSRPSHRIQLALKDEQDRDIKVFPGYIETALTHKRQSFSPGLYTKWLFPNSSSYFERLPLDQVPPTTPAKGSVKIGDQNIALRLVGQNGIQVELFLPWSDKWWVARSAE
ncbi:MAG: hypothetical protein HRU19_27535 [Pseudobacteriovorax sp.]|nr:hypothetical protein [Pseudobacteriovorax sp.]